MTFMPSLVKFRLVVQNYYSELTDEGKGGCEGRIRLNFLIVECALINRACVLWDSATWAWNSARGWRMFVGHVGYVARRYINSVAHNKYLELFQEQMASGVFQPHAIFSVLWLTFHDSRFIRRLTGIWSPRGITCPRGGVEGGKVGHGC